MILTHSHLHRLEIERDRLLARVTHVLQADARVNGAWLSGSYGRGEADAWSDLDLHVAVADEHLDALLAEHEALFAKCGEVILIFGGMRSNSMPNGHFWLVQYVPFMLEIDWSIGPTEATTRPEATRVLFDRVVIPVTPPVTPVSDEKRLALAQRQLDFFWAMAPLAIKFSGRGHTRLAVEQVDLLQDALFKVWRALYNPSYLQVDAYHQNRRLEAELDAILPRFAPIIDPQAALNVIRAFCAAMVKLHPALAEMGVGVREEVVREVTALAEIAEQCAIAGGSNPYQGSRR